MADRTRSISGRFTLTQIESAIREEEAHSFEFLIAYIENDKDNLADFKELPLGEFPRELKLTLSSDAAPNGFSNIWQGAMFVGGETKNVIAWRENVLLHGAGTGH